RRTEHPLHERDRMNFKNMFKGPWLWIILIAAVVIGVLSFSSSADGYTEVKTSTMVGYFEDEKVKEVTFVDGDQEIRATLKGDAKKQVKATWLGEQGNELVAKAQQLKDDDKLTTYNVKLPPKNTFLSVLLSFLPFVIFILIFL